MKKSGSIATLVALMITTGVAKGQTSPTPSQAYLQLHKKELAATSYEDLLPLRTKASIAADKQTTPADKKQLFPLIHMLTPQKVSIMSERVDGNKATLTVKALTGPLPAGTSESTVGVIDLSLEDGQWKLEKEKWESKSEVTK